MVRQVADHRLGGGMLIWLCWPLNRGDVAEAGAACNVRFESDAAVFFIGSNHRGGVFSIRKGGKLWLLMLLVTYPILLRKHHRTFCPSLLRFHESTLKDKMHLLRGKSADEIYTTVAANPRPPAFVILHPWRPPSLQEQCAGLVPKTQLSLDYHMQCSPHCTDPCLYRTPPTPPFRSSR